MARCIAHRSLQGGVGGQPSCLYASAGALAATLGAPGHWVYILSGIIWDLGVRGLSSSAVPLLTIPLSVGGFSRNRDRLSGQAETRSVTMLAPAVGGADGTLWVLTQYLTC